MHRHDSHPPRVLLIASTQVEQRLACLRQVNADADFVANVAPVDKLDPFDAVVLFGAQTKLEARDLERLAAYVENGGSLVAIDAAESGAATALTKLLGWRALDRLPHGEYFGCVVTPDDELVRRLPPEFPVVDAFAPLEAVDPASQPVLRVSVRFRDQVVAGERLAGSGRVLVSSLGADETAYRSPALRSLLRRAMLSRDEGPADRHIGVAIVGYGPLGGMGYAHSLAVRSTAGLELVALCDTNPARLAAAGSEFPEASLYESAAQAAADPRVDLAIVATPPSSHTPVALSLLQAGKHVVCEKPLCFSVADADQLIDTALANDLVLTVNQNRRWDADFLTIRDAIAAGRLGDVFNIETFVGAFEHPCREWHSEASISGGAEFDWGAHYIDWTLQLMGGPPDTVMANGHKRVWQDVSNLDQVRVRMLWDDGREAEFLHSDVAAVRRPKFYIQGTKGTLAGYYRPLVTERIEPGRGYVREEMHHAEAPADLTLVSYEPVAGVLREEKLTLARQEPFAFHRNLADHLLLGDPPLAVDYRQTRELIAVLEAAHRSAERGGRPITPG